jgi:hypothetical protein|tara:strand:- start:1531 stop:2121 length:591 start_codon:yes stop_codon:yes gene_type:complete
MNIAIIVVLLLLLGSKGLGSGASCSRGRKDGKVYWLGFCDQRLGGSCIDWDFRVAVQRRIEITYRSHTWEDTTRTGILNTSWVVNSKEATGYDWDIKQQQQWQPQLDKTLEFSEDPVQQEKQKAFWKNYVETQFSGGAEFIDFYIYPLECMDYTNEFINWDLALEKDLELSEFQEKLKGAVKVYLCYKYPWTCGAI